RGRRPADIATVGMEDCAQAVADDMDALAAPRTILVAHSLGGALVRRVAAMRPLAQIVFVAAVGPGPGQTALAALAPHMQRPLRQRIASPAAVQARLWFCTDLDGPSSEQLITGLVAEASALYTTPAGNQPFGVPCSYIVLKQDQCIPPAMQEDFAVPMQRFEM